MRADKGISTPIPTAFLEQMSVLLGQEYPAFQACLLDSPVLGLRVNSLKIQPEDFLCISPFDLKHVAWCPEGYILADKPDHFDQPLPGKHPYHQAGLYYLQEPSAMAAARMLDPQPGEAVLDLAAAPGGKSTHLASLMGNQGLMVSNEIHPSRVWDLAENLERCGVTQAVITNETPARLADHFGPFFDRVLLDAPCSGEGMFRKSEKARQDWTPQLSASCAERQRAILEQAARLVIPGGFLLYTTCTFSPLENEAVVAHFLASHPEFHISPIGSVEGLSPARPDWVELSSKHGIQGARRFWPHLHQGEGHFYALLEKGGEKMITNTSRRLPAQKTRRTLRQIPARRSLYDLVLDFLNTHLGLELSTEQISVHGSYVYRSPDHTPDLEGLKVIHPGWWLGSLHKDRFIPSHALALGVSTHPAPDAIQFSSMDATLLRYLAGESFPDAGSDGWVLITVDGFPLGWGRRVKNVVKNFYPHGLRRA